ncbi:hypothetical protein LX90_002278, partial [Lentzea flava]|nr:hypothetical protein [Lentzea flava]
CPGAPARGRCPEKKGGCADWIEDLAVDGECLGRSRGGLTTKLHLAVDAAGLPPAVILTRGQAGDNRNCCRCSTTSTTSTWMSIRYGSSG